MSFCQRIAGFFHFKMSHYSSLSVKYSRRWTNFPSVQSKFVISRAKAARNFPAWDLKQYWGLLYTLTSFFPYHIANTHRNSINSCIVRKKYIIQTSYPPTPPSQPFADLLADCTRSADYSTCVSYNFFISHPISLKFSH